VSSGSLLEVLMTQRESTSPIGQIALVHRKLNVREVMEVLKHDPDRSPLFGEIAVKPGFCVLPEAHPALSGG